MKNIAKNNIGYTGIVTISRYSKNKKTEIAKVYNQGRNPLFDFLADCLVGDFSKADASMPDKIRLVYVNGDESSAASGFIHSMAAPEKITRNNESCARYSFLITPDNIERSFNRICLYTRSAKYDQLDDCAAFCDIDQIDGSGRAAGASIIVDWELIISNA